MTEGKSQIEPIPSQGAAAKLPRRPIELVVARYNENVSWTQGWPAIIYNKGEPIKTSATQRFLPNVGRESHTYLFHIVNYWDELADMTLFTQGHIFDHLPITANLQQFFDPEMDVVVSQIVNSREWGPDGRIQYVPQWQAIYDSGRIKPAKLSLIEWYREYFQVDMPLEGGVIFVPGAIFSVKRECIYRRPREFYERLLHTVDHHNDPEEGHYCERSWILIFSQPGELKLGYLKLL